jgi:hypothetical protein
MRRQNLHEDAPARTEPVIDQPDSNALARFRAHQVRESMTYVIRVNDAAFEMNRFPGSSDRVEPCRIIFLSVLEDQHPVFPYQRGTRSS